MVSNRRLNSPLLRRRLGTCPSKRAADPAPALTVAGRPPGQHPARIIVTTKSQENTRKNGDPSPSLPLRAPVQAPVGHLEVLRSARHWLLPQTLCSPTLLKRLSSTPKVRRKCAAGA